MRQKCPIRTRPVRTRPVRNQLHMINIKISLS